MKHTLEGSALFPYIAWVVVIGFAGFVLFFTATVAEEVGELEASGIYVERAVDRDLRYDRIEY